MDVSKGVRQQSFVRTRTPAETAEAQETMAECFEKIQEWHDSVSETRPVAKNSALDIADQLSEPFRSSHTISFYILTAIDHLHALRALLLDAHAQHIFAPYTLIRSAIENAATAMWIMSDSAPRAIVVRSLKMEHVNHRDVERAYETLGLKPDEMRSELLDGVITRNGMQKDGIKASPPGFLKVLGDVAKAHNLDTTPALIWQLCSGATHGRNWASVVLAMLEAEDDGRAQVISGKLTSDEKAIAHALLVVVPLVERTLNMHRSRCNAGGSTGESFTKPVPQLLVPQRGILVPRGRRLRNGSII